MNIAEILKHKPEGTKLYTPIWGQVTFDHIGDDETIYVLFNTYDERVLFYNDGKYSTEGEYMLFPSKEMRDWSKFAWKRGNILKSDGNMFCFFDKFSDDSYTCFEAKYMRYNRADGVFIAPEVTKESVENWYEKASLEEAREYIKNIEKTFNGKFDMENLEIVPNKPTEPKFEPYEKVVARYNGYADDKSYYCIGGWYSEILPYNEETTKLIGTTKSLRDII